MRYLSIFTLLVSAASAGTIPFTCAPNNNNAVTNGAPVTAGSTNVTCTGFTPPAGQFIINVRLNGFATFQDSVDNGNHQLTYSATGAFGSFAAANTGPDPNVSFVSAFGNTAQNLASIANWVVTVSVSNTVAGNALPDNSSYTISGVYTYEVQNNDPGIPEPSTLVLVGGVLVLAGIRKFRS